MPHSEDERTIPVLLTNEQGRTVWSEHAWPTQSRGGMVLTPRIACASLRLRQSDPGYVTDWHIAGDPTLIVVQAGVLRIVLRDETTRDFSAGDAFIAADALARGVAFDPTRHGHRAEVLGDEAMQAVHIKLTDFPS